MNLFVGFVVGFGLFLGFADEMKNRHVNKSQIRLMNDHLRRNIASFQ